MAANHRQSRVIVLARHEQGERYWRYDLICPEEGPLNALWRRSQRSNAHAPPDLFHELEATLQSTGSGRGWFFQEHRVIGHPTGIERSYPALQEASAFTRMLWGNLRHAEHFAPLYQLCHDTLAAFAAGVRPEAVHFKALYRFAKEEGYPVKEDWWAGLGETARTEVVELVQKPVGSLSIPTDAAKAHLQGLQRYLRAYSDILLPG